MIYKYGDIALCFVFALTTDAEYDNLQSIVLTL